MEEAEKQLIIDTFMDLGIDKFDKSIFEHRLLAKKYLEAIGSTQSSIIQFTEAGKFEISLEQKPTGRGISINKSFVPMEILSNQREETLRDFHNQLRNRRVDEFRASHRANSIINASDPEKLSYPSGDPEINRQKIALVDNNHVVNNVLEAIPNNTNNINNRVKNAVQETATRLNNAIHNSHIASHIVEHGVIEASSIAAEQATCILGRLSGLPNWITDAAGGFIATGTATSVGYRIGVPTLLTVISEVAKHTGIWLEKHKREFIAPPSANSSIENLYDNVSISTVQAIVAIIEIPGSLIGGICNGVINCDYTLRGNQITDIMIKQLDSINPMIGALTGLYNAGINSAHHIQHHGGEALSTLEIIAKRIAEAAHSDTGTRNGFDFSNLTNRFADIYGLNQSEINIFSNSLNSRFNDLTNNSIKENNFTNFLKLSSQATVTDNNYNVLNPTSVAFGFNKNSNISVNNQISYNYSLFNNFYNSSQISYNYSQISYNHSQISYNYSYDIQNPYVRDAVMMAVNLELSSFSPSAMSAYRRALSML